MIKIGYHPATWIRDDHPEHFYRALDEISMTGWDGFEFAGRWLERYYNRTEEFKELLSIHDLQLTAFYHPCKYILPDLLKEEIEAARRKVRFLVEVGCPILLIDGGAKRESGNREEDYQTVAKAADEMGRIAKDHGVMAVWHQHWGTMFEYRKPFERLMELTDPDLVSFCPDTAQLAKGDFDVEETFKKYIDRIKYVHFKDLDTYRRFIELGKGTIDFPKVYEILKSAGYDGWIVTDHDYTVLSAFESSRMNKRYYNDVLGIYGERDRKKRG